MMRKNRWAVAAAGLFVMFVAGEAGAVPSMELEQRVNALATDGGSVGGQRIVAGDLLLAVYSDRGFEPLWTREDSVAQLQGVVDYAVGDGLDPADYPTAALVALANSDPVGFDILATEILIRVAYHLRFGKVNPKALDSAWNFERRLRVGGNPPRTLQEAAAAPSVAAFLASLFPRGELYADVRTALAQYRNLEAAGGWPSVPPGKVLRKGDVDTVVVKLRARLAVTDGASTDTPNPEHYDDALYDAVVRFQKRHGLDADGVVGQSTYAALNATVEDLIDKLRLSLERGRWVMEDLAERFILVNIASFQAAMVKDREFIWVTRVQVGKPYRATPVFKGMMEYIQVNPTWTVPPTILAQDTLPAIRKDPNYLQSKNMVVLRADGSSVDPATIDWANMQGNFPYMIRQQPGPNNALGRVKFIFPNEHFIFLHDTPSQGLFEHSERAFSSGCIRVEDPFRLAELLMNDPVNWSRADFDALVATGKTTNLYLKPQVPVFLLYLTALAPGGVAHFYEDIYDRDARVLAAMRGAPSIDLPPQ